MNITCFRDSNAKEIDVFVEENNLIHPLEIKKSAAPDRREVKKYRVLDKEHYDILFNATQKQYINKGNFFFEITVPTYTPEGVKTFTGYFNSTHEVNCTDTTEKHNLDSSYWRGGSNYDELHEDVVFKFVQK